MPSQPITACSTPCNSRSDITSGTRTRRQTIGLRCSSLTFSCRIEPPFGSDDVPSTMGEAYPEMLRPATSTPRNLVHSLKTQTLTLTKRQSKARIEQIKRQLAELEAALLQLLRECPKHARAFDILCSIPGLGRVTAAAILIECPEIGTLSRKQIASLAPMTRQSGQWRGKAFIQGGRKFLRAARYNTDLKQKYQSMIEAGKPAKVALTALMRKMIELANALVQQKNRKWTPKTA